MSTIEKIIRVALYEKNNFRSMGDTNHFVQLTDKKSWRCRIVKGPQYLVATPAKDLKG